MRTVDGEACADCQVRFDHLVSLGDLSDPATTHYFPTVVVDRSGNFYVAPASSLYEVLVYDSSGQFVRAVGRRGRGPGEFSFVRHIAVSPAGDVHTIDAPNRYTRWSSGMSSVIATATVPFTVSDWIFLDDTTFVVQPEQQGEVSALQLAVFKAGRLVTTAIAPQRSPFRIDRPLRRLGSSPGGFVASWLTRYRMEKWSGDGRLTEVLERSAEWFPPRPVTQITRGPPTQVKPDPVFAAVAGDGHGRIWTIVHVADPDWRPIPNRPDGIPMHPDSLVAIGVSIDDLHDSVVEVIDAQNNKVVAAAVHDSLLLGFVEGRTDLVFAVRDTTDGNLVVDIFRVRLALDVQRGG